MTKSTIDETKGIGGWLILFVISISFFAPLVVIYNISINYKTILKLSDPYPLMLLFYTIGKLINISTCCYGFYVSYCLIKKRTKAPSKAKLFILFIFIQTILLCVFPFFYGIPLDVAGAFPGQCLNLRDHYTTGRNRVNLKH